MMAVKKWAVFLTLIAGLGFSLPTFALTFQERLDAQRAIEKVYYEQRSAYTQKTSPQTKIKPFEEAITDKILRAKMEKSLAYSELLESVWQKPLTAYQLQREMERMAKGTKAPGVLRALFEALDNDPELIAETLARQSLATRLVHNWYAFDANIHKATREKAERIRDLLIGGGEWKSFGDDLPRAGTAARVEYGKVTLKAKNGGTGFQPVYEIGRAHV